MRWMDSCKHPIVELVFGLGISLLQCLWSLTSLPALLGRCKYSETHQASGLSTDPVKGCLTFQK